MTFWSIRRPTTPRLSLFGIKSAQSSKITRRQSFFAPIIRSRLSDRQQETSSMKHSIGTTF
ncbi:MAG: hypothetical protein B7Z52_04645, partial [Burkholderiales bacterium 12-64-5]